MNLFLKSRKFSNKLLNNLIIAATVTTEVTYEIGNNYYSPEKNIDKLLAQAKNAWIDFGASVVNYFKSYQFKELIFTLKAISFALCVILLAIIIYVFIKSMALGKPASQITTKISKKKMFKQWTKIGKRFNSGIEANYKLAVLEADIFYDKSLKIIGYDKEGTLSNIEEIKKAKRIKNRIIDDSEFVLSRENAADVLIAYKRGLEELGIL
jgi:hypothetical protein